MDLKTILVASFATCTALTGAGSAYAADLTVNVSAIAHDRGAVRVVLYRGAEGFRHEERSVGAVQRPAAIGTVSALFEGLMPDEYAVIAYHDENGDGKMNRFLGMVPTEGYGLSNDPEVSGPPKFSQAAFTVPEEGTAITITLNY